MLTKDETRKLKKLINDYSLAEMNVGSAKSIGDLARTDAVKEAVLDAAAKMELLLNYIDKELTR
jgi:hypothetical protein